MTVPGLNKVLGKIRTTINVVNAAVSDCDGELNVALDPGLGCPGKSMRGDRWCKDVVRVTTLRLDAYFAGRELVPDVFKVDVEGAELMALKGLGRRVRKSDRSSVQFTGNWSPQVRTPFVMF